MKPFVRIYTLLFISMFLYSCGGSGADGKFTGRNLDLYSKEDTFMVITRPDGTDVYTRSSSFVLSPDGLIVTGDGFFLSPGIAIPSDALSIKIDQDGEVSVVVSGSAVPEVIGTIFAAHFVDSGTLRSVDGGYFEETATSGSPEFGTFSDDGFGALLQGFLEQ